MTDGCQIWLRTSALHNGSEDQHESGPGEEGGGNSVLIFWGIVAEDVASSRLVSQITIIWRMRICRMILGIILRISELSVSSHFHLSGGRYVATDWRR